VPGPRCSLTILLIISRFFRIGNICPFGTQSSPLDNIPQLIFGPRSSFTCFRTEQTGPSCVRIHSGIAAADPGCHAALANLATGGDFPQILFHSRNHYRVPLIADDDTAPARTFSFASHYSSFETIMLLTRSIRLADLSGLGGRDRGFPRFGEHAVLITRGRAALSKIADKTMSETTQSCRANRRNVRTSKKIQDLFSKATHDIEIKN
jgi:hypothetical protein